MLYDGERKNFAGFVKDEKPHKKKLFAGSAQKKSTKDGEREKNMYEFRAREYLYY